VERLKSAIGEAEYPLGIFAENDDFAVFVIEACEKLGLRVPEEVALLGCGNHALIVDFSPVALSSIEQNFTDRAYRAAQLLDRLMAGEPAPKEPIVVEPGEVVTRRSTDILAVKDRRVARAVDWIRRNYAEDWLDTPGVAKFCGLSTRTLTRLFNKHLGWSVADEIRQTRIRQACQLLEKTELTFSEIAEKVGFASLQHFRRNFLQTTKISPREWREQRSRPCAL
jgi:LacI family transcriptional regulator